MLKTLRATVQNHVRDIVGTSLLLSACMVSIALSYGRTGRFFELLSKLTFAVLVAMLVRLATAFLWGEAAGLSTFRRFGMKRVHEELSTVEVKKRLARAKTIDVMKTWFPDHDDIREGLYAALNNSKAVVRLLLSDPDSDLLRMRSVGAQRLADHGSREITQTLQYLCNTNLAGKFEIALHNGWPGCPIIWYGNSVLLGFYLRGRPSPFWPWIEVEKDSDFGQILRGQFEDLWNHETTRKIIGKEGLEEYLLERARLNA